MEYTVVIVTPLLTFLFNYIFYRFIRSDVEQKIHQNNISYSGVFQEKIKVYREFLEKVYDLRLQTHLYHISETDENAKRIALLLHEFMKFYKINRPFISDSMHKDAKQLQKTFTLLYNMQHENLKDEENEVDLKPVLKEFDTMTLDRLEEKLILEMKEDLKTL